MATCDDVVRAAYVRANIADNLTEVFPTETSRGLSILQDIYLEMVAGGAFGRFQDVAITEDYTAKEQDRILVNTTDAVTVTIPEIITDTTVPGNTRPPYDGSAVAITDVYSTARKTYIYDSSYAYWTLIEGLVLSDYAPLSVRYSQGLEARLAIRLADENSEPVTPEMRRQEAMGLSALLQRFDSPRRTTQATYF